MEENNSVLNTKSNAVGFGMFFGSCVAIMVWFVAAVHGLQTGRQTAREEVQEEISPYLVKATGMKFTEWLELQRQQEKIEKAERELQELKSQGNSR